MAGAGYKLFNTGDVLTAAQVNTYLQEQVVMVFANAAARTTALSGVLAEGMVSYLKDTDALEIYSGAAWVGYGSGDITGVTAGTGISGGGTSGTVTITNSMATEITAAGDIIVGTGSGTFDNLPIGTTGQVLTADTTVSPYKVKWATAASGSTFAGWLIYKTATQSIANSSSVFMTWESETYDTDAYHSTSSNTSRATIPSGKAGKYLLVANIGWANGTTGERYVNIWKNGAGVAGAENAGARNSFGNSNPQTQRCIMILDLAVGDYVEVRVVQTSGGSLNTTADECNFMGYLIGA
jgi:hypothetical protein